MLRSRSIRLRQAHCRNMILLDSAAEAISHSSVERNVERKQHRNRGALFAGDFFKLAYHGKCNTLFFIQWMHTESHQSAGRMHFAEKVKREMHDLHDRDYLIPFEHAHVDDFFVLRYLKCRLFSVLFAAFIVEILVCRVCVKIDIKVAVYISNGQFSDCSVCVCIHSSPPESHSIIVFSSMISIPSSRAFLFLPEVELISLLIK